MHEDRRRTRRTRLALAISVGILAAVSVGAGVTSLALFTDQKTVSANAFTTGTITLGTNPSTALVTFANMAPGDVVTAPMTVSNTGSLALRYAVSSSTTNTDAKGLAATLNMAVKSGVTTCTTAGFATDGTSVYTGILGAVGPAVTKVIGDNTSGQQTGDRTLAAAGNEILCFQVTLPLATGNALQAATTTATFTFDAEQTKNN